MSKYLKNVPEEHTFKLGDKEIHNLKDLLINLKDLNQEDFKHYVGEEHNHFVSWIYHVIKDKKLANKLDKVKSKQETIEIIEKRINKLESKKSKKGKKRISEKVTKKNKKIKKENESIIPAKLKNDVKKDQKSLYEYHLGREVAFAFFTGLIVGIFIGMILLKSRYT